MEKTFQIHSFGCKVNQEEGEALSALFTVQGWREAGVTEPAGLYIVNTCTVTHRADSKARQLIRKLRAAHPQALLAVTGCYAQASADELARIDGVDLICGLQERARLPQLVAQRLAQQQPLVAVADIREAHQFTTLAAAARQHRVRAYLKVEDGCDQFCHYCIIPHVRGPVRSLPLDEALQQAGRLLVAGHQEIVLSGIHIGAYGEDLPPGQNLAALVRGILALAEGKIFRLRLGSIEPQQFSEELLALIGSEQWICPHLHIPLQSGCDTVLRSMNRHYDTDTYATLVARLRELRPGLAITSDLIVGFPGESAAHFEQSCQFIQQIGFAGLHVFPYSPRQGTPAATMPQQVPEDQRKQRAARLTAIARTLSEHYMDQVCAAQPKLDFLYEQQLMIDGKQYSLGHSGNYLNLLLEQDMQGCGITPVRPQGKLDHQYLFCKLAEQRF